MIRQETAYWSSSWSWNNRHISGNVHIYASVEFRKDPFGGTNSSLFTEKDDSLLLPAKSSKWYPLHFVIMVLVEDLLNDKLTLKKTGYGINI